MRPLLRRSAIACYPPTPHSAPKLRKDSLPMLSAPRDARPKACLFASLLFTCLAASARADQGEAQWIWSPAQPKGEVPVGDCYFRKTFDLDSIEEGQIHVT